MFMIKIYGLTRQQQALLEQVAIKNVDKKSISLLAKKLLLDILDEKIDSSLTNHTKNRTEIRLNPKTKEKLKKLATQENMNVNRFIAMLLNNYVESQKIMSTTQLQLLRESNYQLYQIGKNINQIAKALNQGLQATVSSAELEKISKFITNHTDKVTEVISKTPSL